MKGIFVSYRRSDVGSHAAGRISQYLSERYGRDLVYFDIQDIQPGHNFDAGIDQALGQCHAFIVMIDKYWTNTEQLQRLHNPEDFVRREITVALGSDVLTLPVTIENTPMPNASSLPDCLKSLCLHQALPLRHTTFERDIAAVFDVLDAHYTELEAVRNAMPCPHCGAPIQLTLGERSVTCGSCGAHVGVLRVMLGGDNGDDGGHELTQQLQFAAMDVAAGRYHEAYDQYCTILGSYPNSWQAMVNKAICIFWIGSEDLAHLPEVFGLLDKSDALSNGHPKVHATRRSLAYNLAAIAHDEDMVGTKIDWSLGLFELSRSLEPEDEERDRLIADYIERCFEGVRKRLVEFLVRDGKSFDPPLSELTTLKRLINMGGSSEIPQLYVCMGERKLALGQHIDGLEEDVASVEAELVRVKPNLRPFKIVLPFFGEPRLE